MNFGVTSLRKLYTNTLEYVFVFVKFIFNRLRMEMNSEVLLDVDFECIIVKDFDLKRFQVFLMNS